jgi:hypothetical protein
LDIFSEAEFPYGDTVMDFTRAILRVRQHLPHRHEPFTFEMRGNMQDQQDTGLDLPMKANDNHTFRIRFVWNQTGKLPSESPIMTIPFEWELLRHRATLRSRHSIRRRLPRIKGYWSGWMD